MLDATLGAAAGESHPTISGFKRGAVEGGSKSVIEELESKPTPFASHLTLRDKIVGVVTAVVCVAVMLLLNLRDFAPRVRIPAGADV